MNTKILFPWTKQEGVCAMLLLLILVSPGLFAIEHDNAKEGEQISVMTQNLFMGTDFPEIIAARTHQEFFQAVTLTYRNVLATRPAERMAAVAREIAMRKPDLIGLQEAAILRIGPTAPATYVEIDMLQILLKELRKRGQPYAVIAVLAGLDAEAPSTLGFDVRFTVQDVIIARTDRGLRFINKQAKQYAAQLTIPTAIGPVTNLAGWVAVDVIKHGKKFRFASTHLALASDLAATIPLAQAKELFESVGKTRQPVVLAGDFNSTANDPCNPTFATYQSILNAGFDDGWAQAHRFDLGYTCCQEPNVSNAISEFSYRIDLIFTRGDVGVIAMRLIGDQDSDRTPSSLWPSDHAGINAVLRIL